MPIKLTRDKWMDEGEFKRLIYAATVRPHRNAKRDRALLLVSGLGGLRCAEALAIQVRDCEGIKERPYPRLLVRSVKRRRRLGEPKTDEITLPITAARALEGRIAELTDRRDFVRLFPLIPRHARKVFKHYAKLAGLNPKLSFHSLRHFRGVQLWAATKDIQLVREGLRHTRLSSTEVYMHAIEGAKAQAAADIDLEGCDEDGLQDVSIMPS